MKATNAITKILRLKQLVQGWRRRISSAGSLPVYVGSEHRRFMIHVRYLNLPVFVSLLNKADEEFGFQSTGTFVLPCDVVFFTKLLHALERDEHRFGALDLDDFTKMFSYLDVDSSSSCNIAECRSFSSLLQKNNLLKVL
ncbi:hypothetical protein QVD17_28797 [Tagetes erecta]|uniref:Small auxin up regulated protein n=1 Tax=Tagetes erecta TaxID=13708 RepID=A0AAD8KBG3_TARER|nr:hypothetical protein QVD17_28797 [Tagetes erecta]